MKKELFNLDSYLEEAEERFSGFDADDLDLDFDAGWEDDDIYEDFYGAAGNQMAAAKSPTPYQVSVANTTGGTLAAVLFGHNKYLQTANYGSAVGVTVTPSQSNVSYLELLIQSSMQPFETSLIRIQSSNSSQITQIITITSKDANGQECSIPLITQSYFSANQFQSGIIDVPYNMKIDGSAYLTFNVLANTTVVLTFFPKDKVNVSRTLNGKGALKPYAAPSVAIGIPTVPVRPTKRPLRRR